MALVDHKRTLSYDMKARIRRQSVSLLGFNWNVHVGLLKFCALYTGPTNDYGTVGGTDFGSEFTVKHLPAMQKTILNS